MGMVTEWHAVGAEEVEVIVAMDPDEFEGWLEAHPSGHPVLDLDKQWHAVHAAMTGTAWETDSPGGRAVLGGVEFGEDFGYGPPRLLSPADVAEVADELDQIGADRFAAAISTDRLRGLDVYPDGVDWGHPDERRYLVDSFEQLRSFYRASAAEGRAMVIIIS